MPFKNERRVTVKPASDFKPGTMKRESAGDGVDKMVGEMKSGGMATQAMMFDMDKFTPEQMRQWMSGHGMGEMMSDGGAMNKAIRRMAGR